MKERLVCVCYFPHSLSLALFMIHLIEASERLLRCVLLLSIHSFINNNNFLHLLLSCLRGRPPALFFFHTEISSRSYHCCGEQHWEQWVVGVLFLEISDEWLLEKWQLVFLKKIINWRLNYSSSGFHLFDQKVEATTAIITHGMSRFEL
jgi:hypothetical protein